LPFGTRIRCGEKPGEYLSGSWLLIAPFFALSPEQNDHKRWNNTEDQEAPQRFVIADRVPKYNGEPRRVQHQCKPENSAPLFRIHNDPNIAQGIIGVEYVRFDTAPTSEERTGLDLKQIGGEYETDGSACRPA